MDCFTRIGDSRHWAGRKQAEARFGTGIPIPINLKRGNTMSNMRAKFAVSNVQEFKNEAGEVTGERLSFNAVCKSDGYPADGTDENNTFARWSPSAECHIHVANPNLFGQFERGKQYYVDFTPAD